MRGGSDARERERGTTRTRERAWERARELFSRVITGRRRERGVARGDGCARVGPSRVTGALSARDRDARSGSGRARGGGVGETRHRTRGGGWDARVVTAAGGAPVVEDGA